VFGEEEIPKNTFNEGKLLQARNNLMMKKPMTVSSEAHHSR
jgi:hypothetical protein